MYGPSWIQSILVIRPILTLGPHPNDHMKSKEKPISCPSCSAAVCLFAHCTVPWIDAGRQRWHDHMKSKQAYLFSSSASLYIVLCCAFKLTGGWHQWEGQTIMQLLHVIFQKIFQQKREQTLSLKFQICVWCERRRRKLCHLNWRPCCCSLLSLAQSCPNCKIFVPSWQMYL